MDSCSGILRRTSTVLQTIRPKTLLPCRLVRRNRLQHTWVPETSIQTAFHDSMTMYTKMKLTVQRLPPEKAYMNWCDRNHFQLKSRLLFPPLIVWGSMTNRHLTMHLSSVRMIALSTPMSAVTLHQVVRVITLNLTPILGEENRIEFMVSGPSEMCRRNFVWDSSSNWPQTTSESSCMLEHLRKLSTVFRNFIQSC